MARIQFVDVDVPARKPVAKPKVTPALVAEVASITEIKSRVTEKPNAR
jgi:hypothetical protein